MQKKFRGPEGSSILLCVDSYDKGIPSGRIYSGYFHGEVFDSLTQFLIRMEEELEYRQKPQSYTVPRTFSSLLPTETGTPPVPVRKGAKATFELRILFRQHTSWQGVVRWQDRQQEQSFRSVLELILLMDSAMRNLEGTGAA